MFLAVVVLAKGERERWICEDAAGEALKGLKGLIVSLPFQVAICPVYLTLWSRDGDIEPESPLLMVARRCGVIAKRMRGNGQV